MPGIFISDGTMVRIPAGGLRIELPREDGVDVAAPSLTLELALDMWPHWLDVAIDSARVAMDARAELVAAVTASGDDALEGNAKGELLGANVELEWWERSQRGAGNAMCVVAVERGTGAADPPRLDRETTTALLRGRAGRGEHPLWGSY